MESDNPSKKEAPEKLKRKHSLAEENSDSENEKMKISLPEIAKNVKLTTNEKDYIEKLKVFSKSKVDAVHYLRLVLGLLHRIFEEKVKTQSREGREGLELRKDWETIWDKVGLLSVVKNCATQDDSLKPSEITTSIEEVTESEEEESERENSPQTTKSSISNANSNVIQKSDSKSENFEPFQSSFQKMTNLSSTVEFLMSVQKKSMEEIQKEFEQLTAEIAILKKENEKYREKYGTL